LGSVEQTKLVATVCAVAAAVLETAIPTMPAACLSGRGPQITPCGAGQKSPRSRDEAIAC